MPAADVVRIDRDDPPARRILRRAEEQPPLARLDEVVRRVEAGEQRARSWSPALARSIDVDLAVVARAALGGDHDPAAVRGHMDHRHDLLAIRRLEDQGVRRLRVAEPVEIDPAEVLLVFRRHAAGLREPQVVEAGPVARPRDARELHVAAARHRDRSPSPRRAPGSPGDRCRPRRARRPPGGRPATARSRSARSSRRRSAGWDRAARARSPSLRIQDAAD